MQTEWRYLPIIKWKRGEKDALRFLTDQHWDGVVPLIEFQPISAAPDGVSLNQALPEYVEKISKEIIKSIPEDRAIAIDTVYVSTGFARQIALLLAVCRRLQKLVPNRVIPAIRASQLDALSILTTKQVETLKNMPEVILRLQTDELAPTQIGPSLDALAKFVKRKAIHLLLDQYSLVGKNHADGQVFIAPYLLATSSSACASVTLAGGSFPINLTGKKQGVTDIPRVEWKIWLQLAKEKSYPKLRFSDYTVSNPAPQDEDIDPKNMNPSIAIRYASDEFWRLYKGGGFKKGSPGVLRNLSKLLVTDPIYGEEGYSYGDKQYMNYSNGTGKNGIPWTWRRDATNRHIVLTIKSLKGTP